MYPNNFYEPVQEAASAKWCSSFDGEKMDHTYTEDVDALLDCNVFISDESICDLSSDDWIYNGSGILSLSEFVVGYLNDGQHFGFQKIIKHIIPPRTASLIELTAEYYDIYPSVRSGSNCPGFLASEVQYNSNVFELVNELYEETQFWIIINTNMFSDNPNPEEMKFDFEILQSSLTTTQGIECDKSVIWEEFYENGCGFYEVTSNQIYCRYHTVKQSESVLITAEGVCRECGQCAISGAKSNTSSKLLYILIISAASFLLLVLIVYCMFKRSRARKLQLQQMIDMTTSGVKTDDKEINMTAMEV